MVGSDEVVHFTLNLTFLEKLFMVYHSLAHGN